MNASSYAARYKELKTQQQRERDMRPRADEPCRKCQTLVPAKEMDNFCKACRAEFRRIANASGIDAAEAWVKS
jgi:hypothetical protein